IYAGLAIGFDGPIAFALLPLVLIAIQTQVIAREERYLEAKFGDDYRRYNAGVLRWLWPRASRRAGAGARGLGHLQALIPSLCPLGYTLRRNDGRAGRADAICGPALARAGYRVVGTSR